MYFYMIKNGDNGKKGDMAWIVINMIKKIKNDDNDQRIEIKLFIRLYLKYK